MHRTYLITSILVIFISNVVFSQDGVTVAKTAFPYTVSIVMQDQYKKPLSLGSGFIVAPGKIITNVHVVEGASFGDIIEDNTGKVHKIAGYTSIDKKNDLILLSVPSIIRSGIELSDKTPEVGEKVYAIGNPKGLSGTISEGIVSGIRVLENNDLFQITAPISPGSSGGPVLNKSGVVIGVSVASLTSGQNLNFAIPVKYVSRLINLDKNILVKLNISTPQVKSTVVQPKEGVFISDIVWQPGIGDHFDQFLHSFSISNLTENKICDLELVAIVYKNNLPIDYFEFKMFPNTKYGIKELGLGPIEPFLGKTVTLEDRSLWNFHCRSEDDFMFNKNIDERVVFRILNYRILE